MRGDAPLAARCSSSTRRPATRNRATPSSCIWTTSVETGLRFLTVPAMADPLQAAAASPSGSKDSLAAALSTNALLRNQLAQSRTRLEQRKRHRALADERTAGDLSPEGIRTRERDLVRRLESLRAQLANEQEQAVLGDCAKRACVSSTPSDACKGGSDIVPPRRLDHSHLVATHLLSLSPEVAPSPFQAYVPWTFPLSYSSPQ